jgi:hypothetical protein
MSRVTIHTISSPDRLGWRLDNLKSLSYSLPLLELVVIGFYLGL